MLSDYFVVFWFRFSFFINLYSDHRVKCGTDLSISALLFPSQMLNLGLNRYSHAYLSETRPCETFSYIGPQCFLPQLVHLPCAKTGE